jgi:hypothetical protein
LNCFVAEISVHHLFILSSEANKIYLH